MKDEYFKGIIMIKITEKRYPVIPFKDRVFNIELSGRQLLLLMNLVGKLSGHSILKRELTDDLYHGISNIVRDEVPNFNEFKETDKEFVEVSQDILSSRVGFI